MIMMNVIREFSYNHLVCINLDYPNERELISDSHGGLSHAEYQL
jgi:hypothetical protein